MLNFSKLRIFFVTLISLLFILISSSNFFKFSNELLNKKINLGLDLQGGSYLLLEIDNTPVIDQKLQNLTITIKNYFKEKNIRINNIKLLDQKLSFFRLFWALLTSSIPRVVIKKKTTLIVWTPIVKNEINNVNAHAL